MTERTNIVNEPQDDATRIVYLPTEKLRPFAEHPYRIIDNDEMASLVESVKTQGVLTPIVVLPTSDGKGYLKKSPFIPQTPRQRRRAVSTASVWLYEISRKQSEMDHRHRGGRGSQTGVPLVHRGQG